MDYKEYYQELGKLLYAIAMADGEIQKEEREKIHEMVTKRLAPIESSTDQAGTDAAYITEFEIDFLEEFAEDLETAYESFADWYSFNKSDFSQELKDVTVELAEEVAKAFGGVDPKEKELLDKLIDRVNS